jgi:hypothetical protein
MGRRITCTPDHPLIVSDGLDAEPERKLAADLTDEDWLPIAVGTSAPADPASLASLLSAVDTADVSARDVVVRPDPSHLRKLVGRPIGERQVAFSASKDVGRRTTEVRRTGLLRLDELALAEIPIENAPIRMLHGRHEITNRIALDRDFWRMVAGERGPPR